MKKYYDLVAPMLVFVLCLDLLSRDSPSEQIGVTKNQLLAKVDPNLLETGDLIFRKGQSNQSQIVLMFDRETSFSHVGLVQKIDAAVYVIHVAPGNPETGKVVRREPLSTFLKPNLALKVGLYRLQEKYHHFAQPAVQVALSYLENGKIFDHDFDLKSMDKLYCTELVWKTYLEAGLDLTEGELDRLSLPLKRGLYIFPSSLHDNKYVQSVFSLSY